MVNLQFLWKQKFRVDKGYQVLSLVNLGLLLTQSETLKGYLGVTSTTLVLLGLPLGLLVTWLCGYLMTLPLAQRAEDRAVSEVAQQRRDLDEILSILKEIQQNDTR
jgi:hypothetical protein